jgi:hypothetical protein
MAIFLDPRSWKQLYKEALFETNRLQIAERIYQAELAILLREYQLELVASESGSEYRALKKAMSVLRNLLRVSGAAEATNAA